MRRRIFLMRHGDVCYFGTDGRPMRSDTVSLSPEGRAQAKRAGKLLAGVSFDRIITSKLPRTRETARLVLAQQPVDKNQPPVEQYADLNELREGRLEDIPNNAIGPAFMGAFSAEPEEDTRFLAGESIGELLDRVLPAFASIVQDKKWDTLLLVLHGGVNRALLSHVLSGRRMFLGTFEQAPGCINILDVGHSNIVRAVNINPSDHLHSNTRNSTMEDLLLRYQAGLSRR